MKKPLVLAEILQALGNAKSLEMLTLIAESKGCKTKDLRAQLLLSRREYYTRLSKFLDADLIAGSDGEWRLTKFGVVIYGIVVLLEEQLR